MFEFYDENSIAMSFSSKKRFRQKETPTALESDRGCHWCAR